VNRHPLDQLLDSLPLAQRVMYYRRLAEAALYEASAVADRDARGGLLSMAAGWHLLASELERGTRPAGQAH
jgi:hypothetical protein